MASVIDIGDVRRRFVGWRRASVLRKLLWTVRKAVSFVLLYAVTMLAVLWYNQPVAVERVVDGASPLTLVGPVLGLGLLSAVLALGVAFAVLVPTVYEPGYGDDDSGLRFRF